MRNRILTLFLVSLVMTGSWCEGGEPGHHGALPAAEAADARLSVVVHLPMAQAQGTNGNTSPSPGVGKPVVGPLPSEAPRSGSASFVTRLGTSFVRDGKPFRFVGFNLHDAAAKQVIGNCNWWGLWSEPELDAAFRSMRDDYGATVVRLWAFQAFTNDGSDFSAFDRVIGVAKANGLLVFPVLENQWKHCVAGGDKTDVWYRDGYRSPSFGSRLSYLDYVRTVVERYRDEPAVFAWSLTNEGFSIDKAIFNRFVAEVSAEIKRIDPNHLVTPGQDNWDHSERLIDPFIPPTIDFAEVHDYEPDIALPEHVSQNLRRVLALGKPIIIGEAGIRADQAGGTERRAAIFRSKMEAAFANGATGYLIWKWHRIIDEGYDILPGDPLGSVMREFAADR